MPLKKLTGTREAVDLQADVRANVDPPSITVCGPGRVFFKSIAVRLLGLTALSNPAQLDAIRTSAAAASDADDTDWTAYDAQKILNAVGTLPGPSHILVQRLPGQGTILFRAARPDMPKARPLKYPSGSARPSISILAALRPEGIQIPQGMFMDVPVKIAEDDEGLILAAYFRRGKLHNAGEEPSGAAGK